jgi:uncharacterized protein YfaT (DUF1175 family)
VKKQISGIQLFFWCCVLGTMACGLSIDGLRGAEVPITAGPLFHEATNQFKAMKTTLYQHHTQVDRATGSYQYDCVGFVSYALKQAAPQARESAFKALDIQQGRIPSPAKYRAFFASLAEKPQTGWQAVTKVSELRPGDVVVWEKKTKTASGHAVVIGGIPAKGAGGTWVVMVYDSTEFPHGDDSRPNDQRAQMLDTNGNRSGLGHGLMAFTADPLTGVLTGYCWSPKSETNTVPISAGRPTS